MSSDKITKKELQQKVADLEKEVAMLKNKTQLARNYSILQNEYNELAKSKIKNVKTDPESEEEE